MYHKTETVWQPKEQLRMPVLRLYWTLGTPGQTRESITIETMPGHFLTLEQSSFHHLGGTTMLSGGVKLTIVFHILNCDHDAAKQKHVDQGNTEQTELLAAAIIRSNWIF